MRTIQQLHFGWLISSWLPISYWSNSVKLLIVLSNARTIKDLLRTQNPSSGLCFGTLGVPVGVFQLGWNFTSPTLHDIQHGMPESPRISRGENTDQFSIRSSSVLTALIGSKVEVSYALPPSRCRRCCMHAAALPTVPLPPGFYYQILDVIDFTPLFIQQEVIDIFNVPTTRHPWGSN